MKQRALTTITGPQQSIGPATGKALETQGWHCVVNFFNDAEAAVVAGGEAPGLGTEVDVAALATFRVRSN